MELKEAIKALSNPPTYDNQYLSPIYLNALGLGIEAMKRIDRQRHLSAGPTQPKLPGEEL